MFYFTSRALVSTLLHSQLSHYLGYSFVPIPQLARTMPDNILEILCEEHGGLLSFFKNNVHDFEIRQSGNHTLVRFLPPVPIGVAKRMEDIAFGQKQTNNKPEVKSFSFRMKVPRQPCALHAVAQYNAMSVQECIATCLKYPDCMSIATTAPFKPLLSDQVTFYNDSTKPTLVPQKQFSDKKKSKRTAGDDRDWWVEPDPSPWSFQDFNASLLFIPKEPIVLRNAKDPSIVCLNDKNLTQGYDICRLARTLSTSGFTPTSLVAKITKETLTCSPIEIAAYTPERFKLQLCNVNAGDSMFDLKAVLKDVPLNVREHLQYIAGLQYVCKIKPSAHSHKTVKELRIEHEMVSEKMKAGIIFFMKGQERKKRIKHNIFWLLHPSGTPLADYDVLAMTIFDMLQEEKGSVSVDTIRQKLFNTIGEGEILPFPNTLFDCFPYLFNVSNQYNVCHISRRDADTGNVFVTEFSHDLTKDEVVEMILLSIPPKSMECFVQGLPLNGSILWANLNKSTRESCIQHFGSLKGFFTSFPETFSLVMRASGINQSDEITSFDIVAMYDGVQRLLADSREKIKADKKKCAPMEKLGKEENAIEDKK